MFNFRQINKFIFVYETNSFNVEMNLDELDDWKCYCLLLVRRKNFFLILASIKVTPKVDGSSLFSLYDQKKRKVFNVSSDPWHF